MAEFNAEELDVIEDALEALNLRSADTVAELVPDEFKNDPALTGRLQEYAEIMREAGQAMPPVEASTTVLSAIIDAGREACETEHIHGEVVDSAAEVEAVTGTRRPRWFWWLTASASAAAVLLAVQLSRSSTSRSFSDSAPMAANAVHEEARVAAGQKAAPTELAELDGLGRVDDIPGSALLVPGSPNEVKPKKPGLQRGGGLRGVTDLDDAELEPAAAAPRKKSAPHPAGAGRQFGAHASGRSKRRKKTRAYDEQIQPSDEWLPKSESRTSGLGRATKKKKSSLGIEKKGGSGSSFDDQEAQRFLKKADLARKARRCASARSQYKELLRRLRAKGADWAKQYRARAEAGLGLCALSTKKRKSAETHFRKARAHWPSVSSTIEQEREALGE